MSRVSMHIYDPATRLVARAMLEAAGHLMVEGEGEVALFDDVAEARAQALRGKVLLLCAHDAVPEAVQAMKTGVYGYVLLPFVPGELALMVERAAAVGKETISAELQAESLAEAERAHIVKTLRDCKHNQAETARRLDIGRNTLWRKLKEMKIETPDEDPGKGEA